jgi:hypothetical protein
MLVALAIGSASCMGGGTEATEHAAAELAALDQASLDHGARVEAAASLADIDAEEARFAEVVAGHMGRMRGDASDMGGCGMMGADMMGDDALGASLDDMEGMCATHREAMAGMATLPDAKDEEHRHAQRMRDLIDRTDSQLDGMMGAGSCR